MALILEILRLEGKGGELQLGVLKVNHEVGYTTGELPWNNNEDNKSCIPIGEYRIERRHSQKVNKDAWFLVSVPEREGILIHPGNFAADTQGCILIGLSYVKLENGRTIGQSKLAFDKLMDETKGYTEGRLFITSESF